VEDADENDEQPHEEELEPQPLKDYTGGPHDVSVEDTRRRLYL